MNMSEHHPVSGYRWINLLVLSLVGFGAAFAIIGPSALVDSLTIEWGVSFSQSTLAIVLLGGLAAGILGLPAGIASDKWGFKLPLVIGSTVASIGLLVRSSASTWHFFILSNAIIVLGAGFTNSGIGSLIRKWFPMDEIGQANGLAKIMTPIGAGIGMTVVFPLVETVGWQKMWLILGVVYSIITLLAWVFLREDPPLPPPILQPEPSSHETKTGGFLQKVGQIMNRTNILLLFVLVSVVGLFAMAPAMLPLAYENIPSNTIGIILGIFNFVGLPVIAIIPGWVVKKRLSKAVLTICMFVAGLSFISIFYFPNIGENFSLSIILAILLGGALAAANPIMLSVAMSQPGVHSRNVGILMGLLLTVVGLSRLVIPPVVGSIVDNISTIGGAWALSGLAIIAGLILILFMPKQEIEHS